MKKNLEEKAVITVDELKNVLKTALPYEINLEGINEESDLRKDVGLNSIGMLYVAMILEEKYSVQFSNEDFPKLNKVADVIAKVEGRL
ncbi:MAG: acyl carrier protein [Ruminococcaceae bacterium]|nr:acyl carrier protein [Oscillospiraceae bacterium]